MKYLGILMFFLITGCGQAPAQSSIGQSSSALQEQTIQVLQHYWVGIGTGCQWGFIGESFTGERIEMTMETNENCFANISVTGNQLTLSNVTNLQNQITAGCSQYSGTYDVSVSSAGLVLSNSFMTLRFQAAS